MSKSRGWRTFAALVSLGAMAGVCRPASAETLAEAISAAYANNPNLEAQRATQRARDENYVQARSGWRPTLELQVQGSYQFIRTPSTFISPTLRQRANAGAAQFTFSQPIWTGGRTASAVTAANADVLAGREGLRQLESQVIQAVVQAYADVRRDEQALVIDRADVDVLEGQLEENRARFDVGEVTRTDVALAQARFAASQANLRSAEAQLGVSRATYAALTGHDPADLQPEPSLAYLMPANVDEAFDVAERNNPALRGQQYAEQASRARFAGARAERLPTVSLQATLRRANGPIDPFVGRRYDTEETAGLVVSVPLFTGGVTTSRIRQAIENNNADRITVETQRRSVLQTITQNWSQLLANRANIAITDEQVRAAAIASEGTHEEQQVGLRTTIDALNAEQELRAAKLSLLAAQHDEYVVSAAILAAMGRLEARNLIPNQPQYDPKANFRRLRFTWGWTPWEEPIGLIDQYLSVPAIPQSHDLPREMPIGQGLQPTPAALAPPWR